MSNKDTDQVLDLSFYRMAKDVYMTDEELGTEITVKNADIVIPIMKIV
ncbi:hypothetical protein [Bacillus sp. UNC437CL72CviS29]|nr:hypothetical protein [Bacillus sp. UNC437CL72CviS29]